MNNLEQALAYADLGYAVFPCAYRTKRPITSNGFKDATTSHEQITEWWTKAPNANIAISVPENICILDVDSSDTYSEIRNYLPNTVICETPRNGKGYHYWYTLPAGLKLSPRVEFMGGLDLRAEGSYVLVPGSVHPNGEQYKWINDLASTPMSEVPQWVIDESRVHQERRAHEPVDPESILAGVQAGGQQVALFRYACYLRRKGIRLEEAMVLLSTAAQNANPPFVKQSVTALVERVYRKYASGSAESTRNGHWKLSDLLNHEFEKVEWVIKEILPPGFCVFSSDPKLGKSMIMGNLSVAITEGSKAFGKFETSKSGVAYADMEQGEEFAQKRWEAILAGRRLTEDMDIFFKWSRIGDGCVKELRDFLANNPKTRLFVIDILANVWPTKDLVSGTVYQKEYAIISELAKVAKEFNVSIVGVHHKSKNKADKDSVMQASGSVGIVAAADVIWSLSRERDNDFAFLDVSGKNVETRKIRLKTDGFRWTV